MACDLGDLAPAGRSTLEIWVSGCNDGDLEANRVEATSETYELQEADNTITWRTK